MDVYKTYVVGADAFYDGATISTLREQISFNAASQLRLGYLSNWRILHVDGFEDYLFLPGGLRKVVFEMGYGMGPVPLFGGRVGSKVQIGPQEWTNVGQGQWSQIWKCVLFQDRIATGWGLR